MARGCLTRRVMMIGVLVGMLQPPTLCDMTTPYGLPLASPLGGLPLASPLGSLEVKMAGDMGPKPPEVTSVGRRRQFLAQRPRRGHTHTVPTQVRAEGRLFSPVPFYVMLQLDTVDTATSKLKDPGKLRMQLKELKRAGVEGVMCDVWWGIVEREGPRVYDWSAYKELVDMVADAGLKLQAVMSFHQCGGNVGDAVSIPLPWWVLKVGEANPDIFYTDAQLRRNREYISLGCDNEPLFALPCTPGMEFDAAGNDIRVYRTPIETYGEFMDSFADTFKEYMPHVITEAQIGMGPAGELRYPSYPLAHWQWPGIGQFQCYDKYMRADLISAAKKARDPQLGLVYPPHTDRVGNYNSSAEDTLFFKSGGEWNTTQGDWFLSWYSGGLIQHADRILTRARRKLNIPGFHVAGKVAGIHWHYHSVSHAPELTAGYYNTHKRDGYAAIASKFREHKTVFDFTCLEMRDSELPQWAHSRPQELVEQTMRAAAKEGTLYAGENALPRMDRAGYAQMLRQLIWRGGAKAKLTVTGCTYLRLSDQMFAPSHENDGALRNWWEFMRFARELQTGSVLTSWSHLPGIKQSRRSGGMWSGPKPVTHVSIGIDEQVKELMLGGVALYTSKGPIPSHHSLAPSPVVAGDASRFAKKVPRVKSGIQAGVRAGQNGRPLIPHQTVSFRLVEAPTEADMAAHVSALGQSRPGRQQTSGSLGAPTRSAEEDSFQGTQGQAAYLDRVSAASSLLETEPVNFESVLL